MRREVLKSAINTVAFDIVDSGLSDMFARGVELYQRGNGDKEQSQWIEFPSLTEFMIRTSKYNEAELSVVKIMGIEELISPSVWQANLSMIDAPFVFSYNSKLKNIVGLLPKIASLLDRDYNSDDKDDNSITKSNGVEIQTVILSDEGNALSTPERIIELLSSINQIYAVIAESEQLSGHSLAVVGMDSGSEKSFDFLGIAKLMQEFREILQWTYNIIVFHKHNVTMKNLQVAGDTLALVGKISKLENANAISAEDAARMKHGLFSGIEKFVNTGAYIPEMNEGHKSPAITMKPQPRLLTSTAEELVRNSKDLELSSDKDSDGINENDKLVENEEGEPQFTPKQIKEAISLLNQSKKAPARKTVRAKQPRKVKPIILDE